MVSHLRSEDRDEVREAKNDNEEETSEQEKGV